MFERVRAVVRAVQDLRAAGHAHEEYVGRRTQGRRIDPSVSINAQARDALCPLSVELDAGGVAILKRLHKSVSANSEAGINLLVTLAVSASSREVTPAVEVLLHGMCVGRLAESDARRLVMRNQTPLDGETYHTTATLVAEPASQTPYTLTVISPSISR